MMGCMDLQPVISVLGGALGIASFVVTMVDRRRRAISERRQAAHGVSGRHDWNSKTILVRNDGPLPVVVTGSRLIPRARVWPGTDVRDMSALDAEAVRLSRSHFLRPGEETVFPAELLPHSEGPKYYETLVVAFTDHDGRAWETCDGQLCEVERPGSFDTKSRRFRRHMRLEQKPWATAVERSLMRRAVLEATRNPRGHLWWARLLDWWYGWRIGTRGPGFPLGQPKAWRYGDLLLMSTEPYLSQLRDSRPIREWLAERSHSEVAGVLPDAAPVSAPPAVPSSAASPPEVAGSAEGSKTIPPAEVEPAPLTEPLTNGVGRDAMRPDETDQSRPC
jgi:hypothetical protein